MPMKSQRQLDPRFADNTVLTSNLFLCFLSNQIYGLFLNDKLLKAEIRTSKPDTYFAEKQILIIADCIIQTSEMLRNWGQAYLKIQLLNSRQTNHNIGSTFALLVVLDRMKEQVTTGVIQLKTKCRHSNRIRLIPCLLKFLTATLFREDVITLLLSCLKL